MKPDHSPLLDLGRCPVRATSLRRLSSLSLFDDLPEVRRQAAVVAGQHLVKGPLRSFGCLPGMLLVIGGPDRVLLHLDLQLSHHRPAPRHPTCLDRSSADAEKMTAPRSFRSVAMGKPWPGRLRARFLNCGSPLPDEICQVHSKGGASQPPRNLQETAPACRAKTETG